MAQDSFSPAVAQINQQFTNVVVPLAPRGLGYGEGDISYAARIASIKIQEPQTVINLPNILKAVDCDTSGRILDDDGCSDGCEGAPSRAKVFGGGVMMTAAALIGLGKAEDVPLNEVFRTVLRQLQSLRIGYGAHTDYQHAVPNASGCSAVDKAPIVLQNIVKYEQQIMGTLLALDINAGGIDEIMASYRKYAEFVVTDTTYAGRQVLDDIIHSGVAVKDLLDNQCEMYIVLNNVQGMTINQEYVRSVSEGEAQVFGVDVWRMQDVARRAFPGDPATAHKAFLSELVYTLGVIATLTSGDLPVYATNPA